MKKEIHFKLKEDEQYIQLIQLLKAVGAAESGALAQILVTEKKVFRSGEVETRKRAKIRRGEKVETENFIIITE